MTPQAQLVYQNIDINSASDFGAQVRFADVDSLLGRIGEGRPCDAGRD
ncbi:autotransporter domain-containing protein [Bradyrhizobium sp. NAS80.1]|nr:autotransporter domain-containing protein [Bradyrhizobium sp. NAS80.1]